mmetsp:Transcript_46880/g.92273  ORF Transcript_46880/g.92273 Transcript_46880/m.92273 type:complete len:206 (-) Transcript_46880:85-702(-)
MARWEALACLIERITVQTEGNVSLRSRRCCIEILSVVAGFNGSCIPFVVAESKKVGAVPPAKLFQKVDWDVTKHKGLHQAKLAAHKIVREFVLQISITHPELDQDKSKSWEDQAQHEEQNHWDLLVRDVRMRKSRVPLEERAGVHGCQPIKDLVTHQEHDCKNTLEKVLAATFLDRMPAGRPFWEVIVDKEVSTRRAAAVGVGNI